MYSQIREAAQEVLENLAWTRNGEITISNQNKLKCAVKRLMELTGPPYPSGTYIFQAAVFDANGNTYAVSHTEFDSDEVIIGRATRFYGVPMVRVTRIL